MRVAPVFEIFKGVAGGRFEIASHQTAKKTTNETTDYRTDDTVQCTVTTNSE